MPRQHSHQFRERALSVVAEGSRVDDLPKDLGDSAARSTSGATKPAFMPVKHLVPPAKKPLSSRTPTGVSTSSKRI